MVFESRDCDFNVLLVDYFLIKCFSCIYYELIDLYINIRDFKMVCMNYLRELRCGLKCMRRIFLIFKDEEFINDIKFEIKKLEVKY